MATEKGGKGEAQRQPLPLPATTTELYLAAIYAEMLLCNDRIRQCDERLARLLDPVKVEVEKAETRLAPARQQAQNKG